MFRQSLRLCDTSQVNSIVIHEYAKRDLAVRLVVLFNNKIAEEITVSCIIDTVK